MATFCRRYCSDILLLLVCIGFGCYVLSEAQRASHTGPWDCSPTLVALAGR